MNVLWMSRHAPTAEQREEIAGIGFTIVEARDLGERNLNSDEEVEALMKDLQARIRLEDAVAVYGVFPTPLLHEMYFRGQDSEYDGVSCHAAWNISRPVEGGKSTFAHKQFLVVGRF
jgi:hypothetical protein